MSKSWKRLQREMLKGLQVGGDEFDLKLILADIIEATPVGQRSPRTKKLLRDVRAAQTAHPEPS